MSQPPNTTLPSSPERADDWPAISSWNLARMWGHLVRAMAQRHAGWEGVWAADAESASPFQNSATLLRPLEGSAVDAVTSRLVEFYGAGQGGSWLLWSAWPTPDLSTHGFQLIGHSPLMIRPVGGELPESPAELRIVEVVEDALLRDFEAVAIHGYPLLEFQAPDAPRLFDARILGGPFRLWVGYVGEEAVTIAAAYMGERATGGYLVATLPRARGMGYGAAITAEAVRAAPYLPAELQASDDGRPVYLRLGFEIRGEYALWLHPRGS